MIFTIKIMWILFLSMTVGCVTGMELVIRPSGSEFTKPVGGSIVMTCSLLDDNTTSSAAAVSLSWLDKQGLEIPSRTGRMYVESEDATTKKLYITSIEHSDAGQFTCRAYGRNTQLQKSVQLLLFKEITFDEAPAAQNIAVNSEALVVCRASGNPPPDVSWRVKGQRITTSDRYTLTPDGLKIASVTSTDEGEYTCRAEVEVDGRYDERRIIVAVHVPPVMTTGLKAVDGVQGTDVHLSCQADGFPAPQYKFFKNGRQLITTERLQVDTVTGVVYLSPVHKDDEGHYNCTAYNDVGSVSTSAQLHVLVPPSIYSVSRVTALEGQSATLVCMSQGEPTPDLTFFKSDRHDTYRVGNNADGVSVTIPMLGQLEIMFRNVTPDNSGNYTCRARNTVGVDEQEAQLTVQFQPRFDVNHTRHVFAWAGKSRNVTCNVSAEPTPSVVWFHGGRLIDFNETFSAYQTTHGHHTTAQLQVMVREIDQGWIYGSYRCRTSNFLGESQLDIELKRASVPDAPQSVRVVERLPTELVLWAEPPEDDGGMEVTGYRVDYEDQVQDFRLDSVPLRIVGLKPSTNYILRVRAVSDVGAGTPVIRTELTENIRRPYPVIITSSEFGNQAYEYTVTWQTPINGGLHITAYEFKYRRILVLEGTLNFSEPLEDWTWYKVKEDPFRPMLYHKLEDLEPSSYYQLEILALNDLGTSDSNIPFVFSTAAGGDVESVRHRTTLDVRVVVAIVVVVVVVFLVIIDVSCYFMNNCGVTMFCCVHLCGQQLHPVDRGVEEIESEKKPLSDDVPAELESVTAFHTSTGRMIASVATDDDGSSGSHLRLSTLAGSSEHHIPSDTNTDNGNSAVL